MSTLIEKISQASLIYKSSANDEALIAWPLKKTRCKVWFYEDVSCSEFDIIICHTLYENEGKLTHTELATILGFNVVDDLISFPRRYRDQAEEEIFDSLLSSVISDELIVIIDDKVKLTELGEEAVNTSKKRIFFESNYDLAENFRVYSDTIVFPFKESLNISFSPCGKKRISFYKEVCRHNEYDITPVPVDDEKELVDAVRVQSDIQHCVFSVQLSPYISFESSHVDNAIYSHNGVDFVVIYSKSGEVSEFATNLLNRDENKTLCEKKIEWGYYLRLLKDPLAILNFKTLNPFVDIIDWSAIIKDSRFDWYDSALFSLLRELSESNLWSEISQVCPSDLLVKYLDSAVDLWDWNILSIRINADFIAKNAIAYPWDYDAILKNQSLTSDNLENILILPDLHEVVWDWSEVIPLISKEFIAFHLDQIDFDLHQITKTDVELTKTCIISHPNSDWDWNYISSSYDLSFILNNMSIIANHLVHKLVFDRVFISEETIGMFLASEDFKTAVLKACECNYLNFNVNSRCYIWNDKTIAFFEMAGVLNWDTPIIPGFEANPFIEWDNNFFEKYNDRIKTQTGCDRVTKRIKDVSVIENHSDFNWNWDIISDNPTLVQNAAFVKSTIDKINLSLLYAHITEPVLCEIFDIDRFRTFIVESPERIEKATQLASMDLVRNNIKFSWDWSILTRKSITSLKLDKLGLPSWVNKWDWDYLSNNLQLSQICQYISDYSSYWTWSILTSRLSNDYTLEHLSEYEQYWDWVKLTQKLDKHYILENIADYSDYWDWKYLVENKLEKQDLYLDKHLVPIATCISFFDDELKGNLWETITRKFSMEELCDIISKTIHTEYSDLFNWDIEYFYNLPEFDLNEYVANYPNDVNWTLLSSSDASKRLFFHDKSILSFPMWLNMIVSLLTNEDYHWDFTTLAKNDAINWHPGILCIKTFQWDWKYLSEFSNCFGNKSGAHLYDNIKKFSKWIDFGLLSTRNDLTFDDELMQKFIDFDWDWYALSSRDKLAISGGFFINNLNRNWDWNAISAKSPFEVNKAILSIPNTLFERNLLSSNSKLTVSLSDIIELGIEGWDWKIITGRKDIKFDTNSVIEIISKGVGLEWETFSKRTDKDLLFDEDLILLLCQENKPVNWFDISTNATFIPSQNVLSKLASKALNWTAISSSDKLDLNVLWDYRIYLKWDIISKREKFIKQGKKFLEKYAEYLSWDVVSSSSSFEINTNNLIRFKDKLNWNIITNREDFRYSNDLVDSVADYLDGEDVSRSQDISYSEEFIRRHIDLWDWKTLFENPAIIEKEEFYKKAFKSQVNGMKFLERFPIESPKIYHFAHLFNAVNILKDRKILSRKRAQGHFENSAGSNVHRRDTAHSFARFYYRPQSPTQYYNEGLGVDSHMSKLRYRLVGYTDYGKKIWDEYEECPTTKYYRAKRLDSPKCPMPVFFELDLQEVINQNIDKCFYSTGNMQKDNSSVIKLSDDPYKLNTEKVYSTIADGIDMYKAYSQQEFLIKDHLDFSKLHKIRIICFNDEQANILKEILGDDAICSKITTDTSTSCYIDVFHRENRGIQLYETEDFVRVSTDYEDAYALEVDCKDIDSLHILENEKNNITSINGSKIQAQHSIAFYKSATPVTVRFVDLEDFGKRSWLLYSNGVESITITKGCQYHFVNKNLVTDFQNIASNLTLKLNRELFHQRMVYSYHGIAHTARVMWNSYVLAKLSPDIEDSLIIPILYSSLVHDLGKERDMEGEEHGLKSATLYYNQILSILGEQIGKQVLEAVQYHSVDDSKCLPSVLRNPIWIILKDADALDRSRLPGKGCNPAFLRSKIFTNNIGQELIRLSNILPSATEGLLWDNPIDELTTIIESYINK